MAALSIQVPYPVFYDRDGQPLDNGNIYIGVANLDPVTNPLQVYYDDALTITASQPLITSGGYVYRNGTPAQLYVDATDFSITANDSKDLLVYNFPEGTGIGVGAASVEYDPPFTGAVTSGYTVADKLSQTVSVKDFGASATATNAENTAAVQAAAATGLPFTLSGLNITLTATVTITNDVYGPGKLSNSVSMLVVGADNVTVDGVEFEGTATSGTSVPLAVGAIGYSGLTIKNCTLTNCRAWVRNQALSRLTDFRFQNNTVNADFSLVEHITNQNDVVTARGVDGVWITDNNFTVLNVHRVLKIADTEVATTSGTAYRSRNVFVTNNRIVGSTDSNKQVMDLYFFTSDITISGNMIEVTGFSTIVENKTGEAQNYTQNTLIEGNKLSNDYSAIVLQGSYGATTPGYDVGYQNAIISNNSIISTASAIGATRYPIDVRFYDDMKIIGNEIITPIIFAQTTGLAGMRIISNAYATVSENTVSNGSILFTSATTNQQAQPFAANILSIVCSNNIVSNFGGTSFLGGILVETIGATATNLRVLADGNYIKQDVDDGSSAGCIASSNSTFNTFSVQNNVGVMANAAEQRLRILTSTITSVLEANNSWNQIGRESVTYDPPSIAAGGTATTTLTVTGAALAADVVSRVQFSRALVGIIMTAWVSAADTVTVQFYNPTAGALDLASGTLQVLVQRFTAV